MAQSRIANLGEFAAKVKGQVDLVQFLSENYGMSFRSNGNNFQALTPFQQEKTPSFNIQKGHNQFYCFSTGNKGDIFEFVKLKDGLNFPEAVRFVAERAHIPLPEEDAKVAQQTRTQLIQYLQEIHRQSVGAAQANAQSGGLAKHLAIHAPVIAASDGAAAKVGVLSPAVIKNLILSDAYRMLAAAAGLTQQGPGGTESVLPSGCVLLPIRHRITNSTIGFLGVKGGVCITHKHNSLGYSPKDIFQEGFGDRIVPCLTPQHAFVAGMGKGVTAIAAVGRPLVLSDFDELCGGKESFSLSSVCEDVALAKNARKGPAVG